MGIGVWQVILILVIVLIIFGAGKLPRVMGDVAKGIKNFKSGMQEQTAESDDTAAPGGPAASVEPPPSTASQSAEAAETTGSKEDAAKS